MDSMHLTFNDKQTVVTEEYLKMLPAEVQEEFIDVINNVPFISNMVSPKRLRAKDLPRDEKGRIIVDLTNPHILEDMDYFRPAALHYKKYGCYTTLRPNANPNSEYAKWLRTEIDRIWNGMVRPSDGEWIPGDLYFYWNYSPILQLKLDVDSKKKKGNRVIDFPEPWDSTYLWAHYINQSIYGGKYNNNRGGEHCGVIARRGCGKSYFISAMMAKQFICGENSEVNRSVKNVVVAADKTHLIEDGTLNKFVDCIDFCADNTQFPSKRLKNSLGDMHWIMGYYDSNDQQIIRGTRNEVMGMSIKDKPGKVRGKRAIRTYFEEFGCFEPGTMVLMFNGSVKPVEEIKVGDIIMGPDNSKRNVLRTFSGTDSMYKVQLSNGDYHVVNSQHLIKFKKYNWYRKKYEYFLLKPDDVMKIKDLHKGYYIDKSNQIEFAHKEVLLDPYFLGLWLGDGDKYDSIIFNEDVEVIDWLYEYAIKNNFNFRKTYLKQSKRCYAIRLSSNYQRDKSIRSCLKHYNLTANKHIPLDYKINSRDVMLNVIAGFIDTDGTLNQHKKYFEITQHERYKHLLDDLKFMCQSLGFKTSYTTRETKTGLNYRLRISGDIEKIPTKILRKQYKPHISFRNKRNWTEYTFTVKNDGIGEYYGFETDGDNLFLLSDFTIVHNCFPNFLTTYNTALYNAEEGGYAFGTLMPIGTGGEKGNDFSGALEMIYHPEGYHMYPLPNVFDKATQGKGTCLFFIGAYMNRKGYYDSNGNSDIIGAILEVLEERYKTKMTTGDPMSVTQKKAELPLTIQDCIMKVGGNIYPVADLQSRITELSLDPHAFDDVYVGKLNIVGGKVEFQATTDTPIRNFPHKDNKIEGAIEIFKMPEINGTTGNVFRNRYLMGVDPYDNDVAESLSLGSVLVLDAFTDNIVAEYTGRPQFADDFYEICRRLALFYDARITVENNKKGIYGYFSRMHSTYLLTDTFSYLRDKDLVKGESFGNTQKGVTATVPIKNYSRGLIRDWLLKPRTKTEIVNGEEVEISYPQLMDIRNLALLKELSMYNLDGNFDRHDALAMLMLYREDVYRLNAGEPAKRPEYENKFLKDSFFDTYNKRANRKKTSPFAEKLILQ